MSVDVWLQCIGAYGRLCVHVVYSAADLRQSSDREAATAAAYSAVKSEYTELSQLVDSLRLEVSSLTSELGSVRAALSRTEGEWGSVCVGWCVCSVLYERRWHGCVCVQVICQDVDRS